MYVSRHWSEVFKDSRVIPIYKKGDTNIASNYRPISLITNFNKIFEKVLKIRLVSYLNKYEILSNKQYGFKENKSTQDAILDLISKVHSFLDKATPCLCTFIDLSKAFDTVSHPLLLQALEDIGVRGECLKLFESYMSNRRQCVTVRGVSSEKLKIEYGVPQGSVLGPILFLIYINDLFTLPSRGNIIGFADDTAIIYNATTWVELKEIVENDLLYIKSWFDQKLLTLNLEKTSYLPFSCNRSNLPSFNSLNIEIQGNNYILQSETKVKYLGVIIDRHLRWDLHIQFVIKKLQFILYKFRQLCNILDQKQMKSIYHALVETHLNYGILAWGAAAKNHIRPLEILQKRFLKLMLHQKLTYPSDLVYSDAKIFDIRQLFYFTSNVKYHITKKNPPIHDYNTRNKHQYLPPFMAKTIGQRSFVFLGPKLYNTVPEVIKQMTIVSFKTKLKSHILSLPREIIHNFTQIHNN